jgi:ATP-binding cassette, subfamily B, multidrug efflux pump
MAAPAPRPSTDDDALTGGVDARLARRLLAAAAPHARLVWGALAVLLVGGLLQLAGPALTRYVLDDAIPAGDAAGLGRAALLFVGALLLQSAAGYGEALLTARLGQRVMRDLRARLFAQLQRLSVPYFDRTPVGRLVTRVTSDVESLNELFTAGIVAGLGDVFTLLAIGGFLLVLDWRLALATFAVVPAIALVSAGFQRAVRKSYREVRGRLAALNAFLQERLTGMRVVQLFGREADERARFAGLNDAHLQANLRSITAYALYFPAIELLTTAALALLLWRATGGALGEAVTVGTLAAFLQLARRFYQPLQDLSDKFNLLQQALASAERIFRLLDEVPSIPDAGRQALPARAAGSGATVEFRDVWFAYDADAARAAGREPAWVLRGVSFRVGPGESLALVGHTGAGKTTIVQLLLRFHDPQRGVVLLDGVDLRDVPVDAVRARMAYVPQALFLFAGDVASNVRLGSALDDDAVRAALARVGAMPLVQRLPGGLAYPLGERGASLSVGERQLLAFARAIAADPELLVLDEATASVDSALEGQVQGALATLMQGRTTIAIAHRLSTITDASEILVLHHGAVVERGTHAALLAAEGLYARLHRLQPGAHPVAAAVTSAATGAAPAAAPAG